MILKNLTNKQVEKIHDYLHDNDYYVDVFGESFLVGNMCTSYLGGNYVDMKLSLYPCKRPTPLTEEEKQLKHINKLHEQDIGHKRRLIANNEAKLEELRKKREVV